MASRGGKRDGAGRKAGAATIRTREVADKAMSQGVTPLEVMMDNMRFAHERGTEVLAKIMDLPADAPQSAAMDAFKELLRFRAMAQDAAKDAAPYVHPRLANVEHSGGLTLNHEAALAEIE